MANGPSSDESGAAQREAYAHPFDLARIEEAGLNALQTQRQLFYDGWLLRRLAGHGEARAQRQRAFRLVAAACRQDRLLREASTRGTGCRRCSGSRRSSSRRTSRRRWRRAATRRSARRWCRRWRSSARRTLPEHDDAVAVEAPDAPAVRRRRRRSARLDAGAARGASRTPLNSPLGKRYAVVRAEGRVVCTAQVAVEGELAGVFDVVTAPDARGRGYATLACASLLSWAWQHGAHAAYLQVSADNAPAHRGLPEVRLRDRLHLPLPRPAGGVRVTRRRTAFDAARSRARAHALARDAALDAPPPRNRAPAGSSPARSPTSPAAPPGSTAASSPIRTRPRSRCWACAPRRSQRTARSARRRRGRWRPARSRAAAPTSRSRSPASPGPAAARRRSRSGLVCFAWARRGGAVEARHPALRRRPGGGARGDRRAALEGLIAERRPDAAATPPRPPASAPAGHPFGGLHRTIVLCHNRRRRQLTHPRRRCAILRSLPACPSTTPWTTTRARPSPPRWRRSKSSSARARS